MSALLVLALALAAQGAEVLRALEAGAFEQAQALVTATEDPLERARGEAELYHRARDPGRALEAAEAGLRAAPDDLRLRFRAAAASLWLGLASPAAEHAARLTEAVERAALSPAERAGWRRAAEEFAAAAEDLAQSARLRGRAVRRARWTVALVMGGALTALASLFVRAGRTAR